MNKNNSSFLFMMVVIVLALILQSAAALAHGGHGKPEEQFNIMPKGETGPTDQTVIKINDIEISRAGFFSYVRSVGAFQMRADLLQRDFMLHFWIAEGVSRYYPSDINELMPRLILLGPDSPKARDLMNDWLTEQAMLCGLFYYYAEKSKAGGKDDLPSTKAIIDVFSAHAKAQFLEDLVSFGQMDPSLQGMREFADGLTTDQRKNIHSLYTDPQKATTYQRERGKQRWVAYRRDVQKNSAHTREYKQIDTLNVPPDTLLLTANDHRITMEQFLYIYGPVPNDVNWNAIKKSRCAQIIRAYALADEADRLNVVPDSVIDKIEIAHMFYLAADQAVIEFGPQAVNLPGADIDFQFFRKVAYYLNLTKFESIFIEKSKELPAAKNMWIDKNYILSLPWTIQRAYTPEQASYF